MNAASVHTEPPRVTRLYRIVVYGMPGPQGSKRHVGGGRMIESSAKVKPWREAVKTAALQARAVREFCTHGDMQPPIDAPIRCRMIFTLPKPTSAPKRRRTWPMSKPDVSKLARSTEDALSDAGLWRDDARVIGYDRLDKVFVGEDPEALDTPGAIIEVFIVQPGGLP